LADQTVFRAPRGIVRDVDEYARRLDQEFGVELTRAQAAHALLRLGLRQANRGRKR
jgi:hypothetical protein